MTGQWWRDDAACRMTDASLFDPVDITDRADAGRARLRQARAVCTTCPVQAACVDDAETNGDSGVRGGLYFDHGRVAPDPRVGQRPSRIDQPPAPPSPPPALAVERTRDSYYGPADPRVIAELLDILCPLPNNPNRKRAVA